MLGHSLVTQFDGIRFNQTVLPFVDSVERVNECLSRIEEAARSAATRPIVFTTLVNNDLRNALQNVDCLVLDFFEHFLVPLEAELKLKSTHTVGRSHVVEGNEEYQDRIEAINFSLANDDGVSSRDLSKADVILVGVSRSGKTPTCLYMAMQLGVKAANCPLIPEDFDRRSLPQALQPYQHKLFGLTISPERLSRIRNERRPQSKYADLENCRFEVTEAEALMKRYNIPWINSTTKSIEEIATKILQDIKLERRIF